MLAACKSPAVRRALFTATLPETVEELARTVMQAPIRVTVGQRNGASETVRLAARCDDPPGRHFGSPCWERRLLCKTIQVMFCFCAAI